MRVLLFLALLLSLAVSFKIPLKKVKHSYPNAGRVVSLPKYSAAALDKLGVGASPLDPQVEQ
jgi:hypothetical protein